MIISLSRPTLILIPDSHLTTPPPPQNQALTNLSAVLTEAGSSIDNVVKVNVFLTSMDNFAAMNREYMKWFGDMKPVSLSLFTLFFFSFLSHLFLAFFPLLHTMRSVADKILR